MVMLIMTAHVQLEHHVVTGLAITCSYIYEVTATYLDRASTPSLAKQENFWWANKCHLLPKTLNSFS